MSLHKSFKQFKLRITYESSFKNQRKDMLQAGVKSQFILKKNFVENFKYIHNKISHLILYHSSKSTSDRGGVHSVLLFVTVIQRTPFLNIKLN